MLEVKAVATIPQSSWPNSLPVDRETKRRGVKCPGGRSSNPPTFASPNRVETKSRRQFSYRTPHSRTDGLTSDSAVDAGRTDMEADVSEGAYCFDH